MALIEPEYATLSSELESVRNELSTSTARVETLYGKQGRGKQFKSERERNAFLQKQINSLGEQVESDCSRFPRSLLSNSIE